MSFKTSQPVIAAAATLIVAARLGRKKVTVVNPSAVAVYLGDSGVTTATGVLLAGVVGASVTIETDQAVYGVVAASTQAVSAVESW